MSDLALVAVILVALAIIVTGGVVLVDYLQRK